MTAKTILALAQAHRKEPSRANYADLSRAVRKLEADAAHWYKGHADLLKYSNEVVTERDSIRAALEDARKPKTEWLECPHCKVKSPVSTGPIVSLADEADRIQLKAAAVIASMNANADARQKAEIEQLRTDAVLWRAFKARKDAALAAGLGRSPLRDGGADPGNWRDGEPGPGALAPTPANCGTGFCSCIECVMEGKQ